MHFATLIFALTYILISLGENSPRKLDRPTAALLGAVLMVAAGALTRAEAAAAVDFGTLAVLFGMMALLAVLIQSGIPAWLAFTVLRRCHTPHTLLVLIVFVSGIASAVVLNDTVCLLGTPLVLEIAAQADVRPTPYLVALATSANIGSVMTLTGNPQNIIIGSVSGWGWAAFALRMIPVGLICLLVAWGVLELLYRRALVASRARWDVRSTPSVAIDRRLAVKSVIVLAGLVAAFIAGAPMDYAAVAAATVLLVWANRPPRIALERVDWSLLLFFAGLFVVVAGMIKAERAAVDAWTAAIGGATTFPSTLRIGGVIVIGSNIFSNVPFVLIVRHWAQQAAHPAFAWMLVALASTFAGNLTLFGSVANVIVAQGAQRRFPLGFMDFLRAGVPVTIATTVAGCLLLWLFFSAGWI